jgi:hypothetical protein
MAQLGMGAQADKTQHLMVFHLIKRLPSLSGSGKFATLCFTSKIPKNQPKSYRRLYNK